ncbi:hypothetical protein V6x_52290 [Gimesia chilikensis]|nr:hypothetical protein V6x_52290 [Gimesia chilikensis]
MENNPNANKTFTFRFAGHITMTVQELITRMDTKEIVEGAMLYKLELFAVSDVLNIQPKIAPNSEEV